MAEGLLPPPSNSVSDIMATAKAVFRLTLAKCLPLALFAGLCYGLPIMVMLARGKMPDGTDMVAVNVRCLDDVDFDALSFKKYDGKSR